MSFIVLLLEDTVEMLVLVEVEVYVLALVNVERKFAMKLYFSDRMLNVESFD